LAKSKTETEKWRETEKGKEKGKEKERETEKMEERGREKRRERETHNTNNIIINTKCV